MADMIRGSSNSKKYRNSSRKEGTDVKFGSKTARKSKEEEIKDVLAIRKSQTQNENSLLEYLDN